MSGKNEMIKTVEIKDMYVENLKIKGFGGKTILIKNLTLKNVRLIFKLPPEKLEKKE